MVALRDRHFHHPVTAASLCAFRTFIFPFLFLLSRSRSPAVFAPLPSVDKFSPCWHAVWHCFCLYVFVFFNWVEHWESSTCKICPEACLKAYRIEKYNEVDIYGPDWYNWVLLLLLLFWTTWTGIMTASKPGVIFLWALAVNCRFSLLSSEGLERSHVTTRLANIGRRITRPGLVWGKFNNKPPWCRQH